MKKDFKLSFFIVTAFLLLHAVLGLETINSLSPTNDETIYLTSGYAQLKTADYRMNPDHPPFAAMWSALPLLFLNPILDVTHPLWANLRSDLTSQYIFSDLFFYNDKADPEEMLKAGRFMTLLLSLLLGLAIYFWAKELFGQGPGFLALFLWCFSSSFLGHGTLATNDMALTLFCFTTLYFLWRWYKHIKSENNTGYYRAVLTGLSLGLALGSKHTALVILPIMGLIILWLLWEKRGADIDNKYLIKNAVLVFLSCFIVLLVIYQFKSFGTYWASIKNQFSAVATGHRSFFLGKYSDTGWLFYFPVAFILKTPIPFIFLLLAALYKKRLWTKERAVFLLVPVLVFFLISCLSKKQIGHRYILPIYPFLTVWVAGVYPYLNRLSYKIIAFLLLSWYAVMCVRAHPWHLSYFNEFIGSGDNGYKYLTDSNVDWGQGLKALGKYLSERDISKIFLCYCGVGDPHQYGINYIPLYQINDLSSLYIKNHRLGYDTDYRVQPDAQHHVFFAISVNNLQSTYYGDKKLFSWLNEIPYEVMLARSIIIYDLSKYPAYYERLMAMLKSDGTLWERGFELQKAGKADEAAACYKNYLILNPENPQVLFNFAVAQMSLGELSEAVSSFNYALRLQPDKWQAHLYLSECYEKLGNKKLSEKHNKIYEKNNLLLKTPA